MAFEIDADELMTFDACLSYLHELVVQKGMDPKLETVVDLLKQLDSPDLSYRSIQIAGTNGKTSTSRYTAALVAAEGYKVGLFTSPELSRYPERIEIEGKSVSDELFAWGISCARSAAKTLNEQRKAAALVPYTITEFDILTVAACLIFAHEAIDVAVFEVGLGGRWDATTAVASIETVAITGIGLDHMHILGNTLPEIAAEKAAIIKPGMKVVLGPGTVTPYVVEDVFIERCQRTATMPILVRPLTVDDAGAVMHEGVARTLQNYEHVNYHVTKRPKRLGFPTEFDIATPYGAYREFAALKPSYQVANIATALAVSEQFLGRALNAEAAYDAILACPTPGRFQVMSVNPLQMIDACHNPQSIAVFLEALGEYQPDELERPALLFAALADKDVQTMVELLVPHFSNMYVTQTHSHRALGAHTLADIVKAAGGNVCGVYEDVETASGALKEISYVACGSITLAGELNALAR